VAGGDELLEGESEFKHGLGESNESFVRGSHGLFVMASELKRPDSNPEARVNDGGVAIVLGGRWRGYRRW
jgi:hypothetical protein